MYTAYLQTSQLISGILEDRPPDSFTAPFRKRIRVRTPNAKAIHSLRMDVFGPQEWAPCVTSHPYLFSGEIPYIYIHIRGFPEMEASPNNGTGIMDNPNLKWMYIISHRFLAMVTSIVTQPRSLAPRSSTINIHVGIKFQG
jgi:hypothetical protein